jgi:competence protein ComEC
MSARVHESRKRHFMTATQAFAAAASLRLRLAEAVQHQTDRWFLWAPVCLAAGIAGYFALPVEPHGLVFGLAGATMAGLFAAAATGRLQPLSLFLALVVAGVLLAKLRTEMVRHPELLATTGVVELAGWVERVEPLGPGRLRLTVRVDSLAGILPEATPPRLRVSIQRPPDRPYLGQYVTLRARLTPLPGPVEPGGHDFARALWFQGIGATGVGFGTPEVASDRSLDVRWSALSAIEAVRSAIRDSIANALPDDLAGFAGALIIGERSGVPADTQRALQISGLAHILAISGLHMSLMAGSVFWLLRAGLALVPVLALNYPIKKWAACGTLAAGFAYLLISGWGVATQRAYVMLAVMCLAVLLDRPAITMRNLALAGLIILVATPEAVLTASFQMSFMAVMGLIAFYEAVSSWRRERLQRLWPHSLPGRMAVALALSLLAVATTTIVASVFTSLPAAYHFNRVAPYSLLANMLALPIVTTIVMPAAVIAVAAMPAGLEALPLTVMGAGVGWVAAIAHWVADLPGAGFLVQGMPTAAALLIAFGAAWLCLWRKRIAHGGRGAGARRPCCGAFRQPPRHPDRAHCGERGGAQFRRAAGAGSATAGALCGGELAAGGRRQRHHEGGCRAARLDLFRQRLPGAGQGLPGCLSARGGRCRPGVPRRRHGDADFPLRGRCRDVAVRIDRFDVWRHGAHAISIRNGDIRVTTVAELRGTRPWTTPPVLVIAADEVEVAVAIPRALVAGDQPVADVLRARRVLAAPVAEEHHGVGPAHGDGADLAVAELRAVGVHDGDGVARHRLAHGTGAEHAETGAGFDHQVAFGLAVDLVDRQAERPLRPLLKPAPHRLAAGEQAAQAHRIVPAPRELGLHHAHGRRRQEDVAHAVPGHQRKRLVGIELVEAARHHRDAEIEPRQQHVDQPADPRPVRRRPQHVARLGQELVGELDARQMAEQHPVAVQRALGRAGGAGRVDHDGGIVGAGVGGGEAVRRRFHGLGEVAHALSRGSGGEHMGEGGQVRADLGQPGFDVARHDKRRGARVGEAVLQRLDAEQPAERHGDGAELVDGDVGRGRLGRLRQHQRDTVAAADAAGPEQVGDAVGHLIERAIGHAGCAAVGWTWMIAVRSGSAAAQRPQTASPMLNL